MSHTTTVQVRDRLPLPIEQLRTPFTVSFLYWYLSRNDYLLSECYKDYCARCESSSREERRACARACVHCVQRWSQLYALSLSHMTDRNLLCCKFAASVRHCVFLTFMSWFAEGPLVPPRFVCMQAAHSSRCRCREMASKYCKLLFIA